MTVQMSEVTKIGKRYAVVIPKSVRERLKLEEGGSVWVRAEGDHIIIEPLPKDPFEALRLIPDTYSEEKYEAKAERELMKAARARH